MKSMSGSSVSGDYCLAVGSAVGSGKKSNVDNQKQSTSTKSSVSGDYCLAVGSADGSGKKFDFDNQKQCASTKKKQSSRKRQIEEKQKKKNDRCQLKKRWLHSEAKKETNNQKHKERVEEERKIADAAVAEILGTGSGNSNQELKQKCQKRQEKKNKVQTAAIQIDDSESDTLIDYGKCDIAGCTSAADIFYCLNNEKCGNTVHCFPCRQDNNLNFY